MRFQRAIAICSVIIGVFALAGCGGTKKQSAVASPTPLTAQAVLNDASNRFDQLNSFHFVLQIDGTVALDSAGTFKFHGATGDLLRPNSAQAKADVTFLGANLSINLVSVGSEQYMTNPITGSWEKAPSDLGYDPAVLFDKNQGISHILTNLQNPTIAGSETVNGKDAYHITASVNKQDAQQIAGGALQSATLNVDLWVDKQTDDILKLVLHDSKSTGGNPATTWTLLLTKQNEPVTITKPNA